MPKRSKASPSLETVLDSVKELYETNPRLFSRGFETGSRQAKEFKAGRDYMGLILGNIAWYSDGRRPQDTERAFDLNDPTFALGALLGAVDRLPDGGRFSNILD